MRWFAVAAAVVTAALIALHADDVGEAWSAIPAWGFAAAVALHVGTLVLRSEAWRLVLIAITGEPLPRAALHGANAAAFVAGVVQSHAALPVRVALLARLGPGISRRQVALADVPIVVVEIALTCLLVAAASLALRAWWHVPAALLIAVFVPIVVRLVHQRVAHRTMAAGLTVLAHPRLRLALAGVLAVATLAAIARTWVLMAVIGVPTSFASVIAVVVSIGVFGLLPLGPSASPAGTVAAVGASGLAPALVLGMATSAASICAVAVYAVAVGAVVVVVRLRRAPVLVPVAPP